MSTLEISWCHLFYICNGHLQNIYNEDEISILPWFGQAAT